MITNIQQSAHRYYLFIHTFLDCKFEAVLKIYPHRRNALFIPRQDFVVQRMNRIKLFYAVCSFKKHHTFPIAPNNFGLITVLLVLCTPLLEQFTQVLLIELY